MSTQESFQLLRDLRIDVSEDVMLEMIKISEGNIQKAINNYFEFGPPKKLPKKPSNTVATSGFPVVLKTTTEKPSEKKLPLSFSNKHVYLGRREVTGYTLASGYLTAVHSVRFDLQFKDANKAKTQTAATVFKTKLLPKDRFSGGKILFTTYRDISCERASEEDTSKCKDIQGRLMNILCDFLVPLLKAKLIHIRGHIPYDIGPIGTFRDIPIILQIFALPAFFDVLVNEATTKTPHKYKTDAQRLYCNRNIDLFPDHAGITEHTNSLLTWLTEGESGLLVLRQQQQQRNEQNVSSNLTALAASSDVPMKFSVNTKYQEQWPVNIGTAVEEPEFDENDQPSMSIDEYIGSSDESLKVVNSDSSDGSNNNLMPLGTQPSSILVAMRDYQLQALRWMSDREKSSIDNEIEIQVGETPEIPFSSLIVPREGSLTSPLLTPMTTCGVDDSLTTILSSKNWSLNPLWTPLLGIEIDLSVPPQDLSKAIEKMKQQQLNTHDSFNDSSGSHSSVDKPRLLIFYWDRYNHQLSKHPPDPPRPCRGGLLADEMGMGKTLMMISVIVADLERHQLLLSPNEPEASSTNSSRRAIINEHLTISIKNNLKFTGTDSSPHCRYGEKRAISVANITSPNPDNNCTITSKLKRVKSDIIFTAAEVNPLTRPTIQYDKDYIDLVSSDSDSEVVSTSGLDEGSGLEINQRGSHSAEATRCTSIATKSSDTNSACNNLTSRSKPSVSTVTNIAPSSQVLGSKSSSSARDMLVTSCTLIICPMTLMSQWVSEISSGVKSGTIQAHMYYGNERQLSSRELSRLNVVVTSYGTLLSEAKHHHEFGLIGTNGMVRSSSSSNSSGKTLFTTRWRRVVLDEAHTIKNSNTEVSRACCKLHADCRWAITGTPIQNGLDDLYSLLRFLRHEPWDQMRWWKRVIADPYKSNQDPRALQVLRSVLKDIMIRRTKCSKDSSGVSIVQLPTKTVNIEFVELSEPERSFYQALLFRTKVAVRGFEDSRSRGSAYAAMFALLMRMRQACDHPYLVLAKMLEAQKSNAVKSSISSSSSTAEMLSGLDCGASALNECVQPPEDIEDGPNISELFGEEFLKELYRRLQKAISEHSSASSCHGLLLEPSNSSSDLCNVNFPYCKTTDYPIESSASYADNIVCSLKVLSSQVISHNVAGNAESSDDRATLKNQDIECPICLEEVEVTSASISAVCGHVFCTGCITSCIDSAAKCPCCNATLTIKDLAPLAQLVTSVNEPSSSEKSTSKGLSPKNKCNSDVTHLNRTLPKLDGAWRRWGDANAIDEPIWQSSSKINALLNRLHTVFNPATLSSTLSQKPIKVVIFSQWTSMLDLVEEAFHWVTNLSTKDSAGTGQTGWVRQLKPGGNFSNKQNFAAGRARRRQLTPYGVYNRLDGSMSQESRVKAVTSFCEDENVTILLVSLKAGGVGLNLVAASVVILLDPWWNPSTEDQAIDRVHRLGQTSSVQIYRLVCRDTVEERLLALQDKKRVLSQQTIGAAGGKAEMKLTIEDLKALFN